MAEEKNMTQVTVSTDTSDMISGRIIVDQDAKIPMRDGTLLDCDVYRMEGAEPRPVMLMKAPYDNKQFWGIHSQIISPYVMAQKGFVAVVAEDRGREASEGLWRPYLDDENDTYDTIEWCGTQPWSDGNVGMYGNCGYGYESFTGAACGNPHLKAVFAHTTTPNPYHGWTYENGFYHLAFMSAWSAVQGMNTSMKELGEDMQAFGTKWYPAFLRYYLSGAHRPPRPEHAWEAAPRDLPVSEVPVLSELPYWQDWMKHPTYDEFWKASDNIAKAKLGQVKVPVFMLICWYDNSCQANIDLFHALCENCDPELAKQHRLLIGPWDHSAYYNNRASCAGERDFGFVNETGTSLSIPLILGWFKKYLKGEGDGAIPGDNQVRYFQMGENAWHEEPTWPVATEDKVLFLHSDGCANGSDGDGMLAGYTGAADETPDTYDYDPLDPVMSVGGRTMLFATGVFDQAEMEKRSDVLCYTTPLLKEDIVVAGPIKLDLYAATSAVDTDFFAKLVDVEPDGYVANISEGMVRARFRNSLEEPELLEGGETVRYEVQIADVAHTFKAGHKLRLVIQSADFPNFDRNLNCATIPVQAREEEAVVAKQTIFHDAERPSKLTLAVVK